MVAISNLGLKQSHLQVCQIGKSGSHWKVGLVDAQELCHTSWGSYCQSKNHGACPLECKDHETLCSIGVAARLELQAKNLPSLWMSDLLDLRHHCYAVPYDEYGNYNYSATWEDELRGWCHFEFSQFSFSFNNLDAGELRKRYYRLPLWCHVGTQMHCWLWLWRRHSNNWVESSFAQNSSFLIIDLALLPRGYSWCQSKSDPCPVDCGNRSMCYLMQSYISTSSATSIFGELSLACHLRFLTAKRGSACFFQSALL